MAPVSLKGFLLPSFPPQMSFTQGTWSPRAGDWSPFRSALPLFICPSAGGHREELRPWQRSWGRRLGIRKGVIKPQETLCSQASNPKTRVCFMLSPTPLTLRGGSPPSPFLSEKELTCSSKSIKIPGHDKSVSAYGLLWRLSSPPI